MQPIFKEQINMWKDLGYDIPIEEGMYWLNRGIIKAFTSDGKIHNLYKYKVNDDLNEIKSEIPLALDGGMNDVWSDIHF